MENLRELTGPLLGAPSPTRSPPPPPPRQKGQWFRDQSRCVGGDEKQRRLLSLCGKAPSRPTPADRSASLVPMPMSLIVARPKSVGDVPPQYANPFARLVASILDCQFASAVVGILLMERLSLRRRFYLGVAVQAPLGCRPLSAPLGP